MFCNKCGREIAESSMFCTWCGGKIEKVGKVESVYSAVPTPSESPRSNLNSQPVYSVQQVQPEQTAVPVMAAASAEGFPEFRENPAGAAVSAETVQTAETLNPEQSAEERSPENVSAPVDEASGLPEQNEGFSGKSGADMPNTPDMPDMQDMTSAPVSEVILETSDTPGKSEKTRKYYTGAQLAICLVTTGIMAAAAGIFAGLYFSVI